MSKWGRGPAVVMLWMGVEKKQVKPRIFILHNHIFTQLHQGIKLCQKVWPPKKREKIRTEEMRTRPSALGMSDPVMES